MATKTELDVVYLAMRRANIIAIDEEPDANLYEVALDEYKGFHEWLNKEFTRSVTWSFDKVPDDRWVYVAGWFAGRLVDAIPVANETYARVKRGAENSEVYLREILARRTIKAAEIQWF